MLWWFTKCAFQICCRTIGTVWIDTKCIFAAWWCNWSCCAKINKQTNKTIEIDKRSTSFANNNTYDRIFERHNQQPNCNYSGCGQLLYHRKVNHFHMFPKSRFRLCTKRIDHNYLDEHKPVRRMVLDIVEKEHHGLKWFKRERTKINKNLIDWIQHFLFEKTFRFPNQSCLIFQMSIDKPVSQ